MKNKKGSRRNKPAVKFVQDRISDLPDDVLLNIFERLDTPDAVRTCILSKKMAMLPYLSITAWDHWCKMLRDKKKREERGYCEKANVEWEPSVSDLKHQNLAKLTIHGFQPDQTLRVIEAAVNLKKVILYDRKVGKCCASMDPKIKVTPSRYPRTIEEQELLKKIRQDRISDLPDDVLLNIFERLDTPDAVRTCILSKKMAMLPYMLSQFVVDANSFIPKDDDDSGFLSLRDTVQMNGAVVDATNNILTFRNPQIPLHQLRLRFYLRYYDFLSIGKAVSQAMATHDLDIIEFTNVTEKERIECTNDDLLFFAKQFNIFFSAYPGVFAGLTRLQIQNLRFDESDIPNILLNCKKLEFLRLYNCKSKSRTVLRVEHHHLVELQIAYGNFETVELVYLPKLERMTCQIWVLPESSEQLAPMLRELQHVTLRKLPEGCDINWTMFIVEAAPKLKELSITVWDHWCKILIDKKKREESGYCEKANVEWEPSVSDLKHQNLTKLTIHGFQPDQNFVGYVMRMMEVAINLKEISLYDRKVLECCEDLDPKIEVVPSRYLRTIDEQELLKKEMAEGVGIALSDVIHFRS
uniref:F-box domain-containing protein n=1 Tax=Leersia perrieri TaxID=77586 RepID=A0A0D9VMX7_9ORYZ